MSEYRIFETAEFTKNLAKIAPSEAEFLRRKLLTHVYSWLRQSPYFGPNIKKLREYAPEMWRCRLGRFRVFYHVDERERIVFITSVDDRKDAYK